jgi:hypothetical protein
MTGEVADAGLIALGELNQDSEPAPIREHREQIGHHDEVFLAVRLASMSMLDVPDLRHASSISEQLCRC